LFVAAKAVFDSCARPLPRLLATYCLCVLLALAGCAFRLSAVRGASLLADIKLFWHFMARE
jgi:hypothetical protein